MTWSFVNVFPFPPFPRWDFVYVGQTMVQRQAISLSVSEMFSCFLFVIYEVYTIRGDSTKQSVVSRVVSNLSIPCEAFCCYRPSYNLRGQVHYISYNAIP